jgi:hypothetical protein
MKVVVRTRKRERYGELGEESRTTKNLKRENYLKIDRRRI